MMTEYYNTTNFDSIDLDIFFSMDGFDETQGYVAFSSEIGSDHEIMMDPFDAISLTESDLEQAVVGKKRGRKSSSSSLKRKSRSIDETSSTSSSSTRRVKKTKTSGSFIFPASAADDFAKTIVSALNCGDYQDMEALLQASCSDDVKLSKHYYPTVHELRQLEEYNRVNKLNMDDFVTSTQFNNLSEFAHHMKLFNCLIPDGSFKVADARLCFEGPISVFICSFSFSGTLLCRNVNVLSQSFATLSEAQVFNAVNYSCSIDKNNLQQYCTEGSIAFHVNQAGEITNLEFYETKRTVY